MCASPTRTDDNCLQIQLLQEQDVSAKLRGTVTAVLLTYHHGTFARC